MRVSITSVLVLCIIAGTSVTTQAQFLNRLKKKAKDAVQERVEQKIDQKLQQVAYRTVDKTWESVFGESAEDLEKGAAPPRLPFKLNANVKTEEEYRFNRESVMEITSIENGKEESVTMKMYISESDAYSGTTFEGESLEEGEKMTMIYDYKNNAMIMLMDSEDGKVSFAYEWTHAEMETDETSEAEEMDPDAGTYSNPYADYESLGTRTILGYECEGYRTETEDVVTEFWVAKENIEGLESTINANSSTRFFSGNPMLMLHNGTIMEMTSDEKDSDQQWMMKMTKVNDKVSLGYTMSDYPVIGMN